VWGVVDALVMQWWPAGLVFVVMVVLLSFYRRRQDSRDYQKTVDKCDPKAIPDLVRAQAELESAKVRPLLRLPKRRP
jgi:hypothetical protein